MNAEKAAELAARFDHHDPRQAADPHPVYAAIRGSECPVARSETNGGFWMATTHDDVQAVLHAADTFSSRSVTVPASLFADFGFPVLPPITLDGTAHRDFRRIVLPAFTPKTIHRWEEPARAGCREFIDEFIEAGHCDGTVDYARRIPVRVVSLLVGIPPEDEELFASWIYAVTEIGGGEPAKGLAAGMEMYQYFARVIAEHRAEKKDDLLGILVDCEYEGEKLDDGELLGFLFLTIMAGMDTTWSVIGSVVYHLAAHPEHSRYLREDLSRVPAAVEEMLRFYAPAVLGRVVAEDTELNGSRLRAGDSMLVCYPSANRDEKAFADADRAILDRTPNRHLAFGIGVHRCLGASLARMELTVAIEEWLARIPECALADPAAVRWSAGPVRGPKALTITFTPGARS